ncbi:MAG: hypothetical protein ACLQLG_18940 [Thermoguttaceae bacterium]
MTTDDDSLEAVIHAKLMGIAQALPEPPEWYEDWNRLGPESSDEQRISVCQAIRASGCLPVEAGFSLVAWQIDALTEKEAEASLHDLDERMRAVEEAYQGETGQPWPLDQVPEGYPQYEELLGRYQAAWDQIFVRRLEDCGEREMADLYARDPEAFERRYQAGCRYLREPVVFRRPSAPDDLVAVASCLDPPRADLVRMALAREGIPTALGNANYLSWFWHCSNAVGGVPVYVRYREAQRACEVLAAARAKLAESLPPWTCPSCGQQVAGRWSACWQCGRVADGTPGQPLAEDAAAPPGGEAEVADTSGASRVIAVAVAIVMIVLLVTCRLKTIAFLAPLALILLVFQRLFQLSSTGPLEPQAPAEPDVPPPPKWSATRSQLSRAIVRRAWQSAVIGLVVFPPLNFYSMWLLLKLMQRDTPLGRADRWRCGMALLLNIGIILFFAAFCGLLPFLYVQVGWNYFQFVPTVVMHRLTDIQHAMGR